MYDKRKRCVAVARGDWGVSRVSKQEEEEETAVSVLELVGSSPSSARVSR